VFRRKTAMTLVLAGAMGAALVPTVALGVLGSDKPSDMGAIYANQKLAPGAHGRALLQWQSNDGNAINFKSSEVYWASPDTGERFTAYCVNPDFVGYGENGLDAYNLSILNPDDPGSIIDINSANGKLTLSSAGPIYQDGTAGDVKLLDVMLAALSNGYPHVASEELTGLSTTNGLTQNDIDFAAYTGTKTALWALFHAEYANLDDWAAVDTSLLARGAKNAFDSVYKAGSQLSGIKYSEPISLSIRYGTGNDDGSLTCHCHAEGISGNRSYVIYADSDGNMLQWPDGAIVNDSAGNPMKTETSPDGFVKYLLLAAEECDAITEFTITLPKESINSGFSLGLEAANGECEIFYAQSQISAKQNYILIGGGHQQALAPLSFQETGFAPKNGAEPPTGETTAAAQASADQAEPPTNTPSPLSTGVPAKTDSTTPPTGNGVNAGQGVTAPTDEPAPAISATLTPTAFPSPTTTPEAELTLAQTPISAAAFGSTVTTFESRKAAAGLTGERKLDSTTNLPIKGSTIQLATVDGEVLAECATDLNGLVRIPYLSDGSYINRDTVSSAPVEGAIYQIASLDNGNGANLLTLINTGALGGDKTATGLYTVIGDVTTNLPKGWYTAQIVQAPEGYELDTAAHNFQITGNGMPKIIRLINNPILGKISLTKLSSDYNKNTGWDYGTPLTGAVYDVVNDSGVVVDTITTGDDGTATTKPIALGQYSLVEVTAPEWYGIDTTPIKASITRQGQIVSVTAKDRSINLGVTILKTSDTKTADWGDTVNYYITGIENKSNVKLGNFIVHEKLPDPKASAVKYFDTGLWSQANSITVSYATNMNTEYITLPGSYSSVEHHQVNLSADNLGLREGENVTQIKMEFANAAEPGFKLLEAMSARVTVAGGNQTGYQFTNYADVSGRWNGQTVTANSHWTIKIIHHASTKLPKTGY